MAERSTARSADVATGYYDDPAGSSDNWISRRSRLAASDSDPYFERLEAAAPQRREESYEPGNAYQDYEGRHARHRAREQYEDDYEQYDGAYRQHEYAYRRSESLAYPEPAYYAPDQTYQYDEHDQSYQEEHRAQEPYGPADTSLAHGYAYAAQQGRYPQPEEDYARREYPHGGYAGRNEYRHEESDARDSKAEEKTRPQSKHSRELDVRPRPANRRRRWMIPVGGLALAALLSALAFMWGSDQPPEAGLPLPAAASPTDAYEQPSTHPEPSAPPSSPTLPDSSATPSATSSVTPSSSPSATPSVTPSATPSATPSVTPAPTQSPGPVLLGPQSGGGVENLVQRYCDRHTGGSADPRRDGRWQCETLFSASIVNMDIACQDTYDSGAYARTTNPGDAYAWRCYR
ncbi:hypothetical protein ACTMS0_02740 [Micromonospora sp. H33]|uniref:hypothetical protein n=1 Tax=Micromonospora sp. H33 TaxID=3452215 RepID=UPI003F8C789A